MSGTILFNFCRTFCLDSDVGSKFKSSTFDLTQNNWAHFRYTHSLLASIIVGSGSGSCNLFFPVNISKFTSGSKFESN